MILYVTQYAIFAGFVSTMKTEFLFFAKKGKEDNFGEGLGYCDEFRCALHESNPFSKDASKTK